MSPSRTVIVGSAVPLLILIGLVGFPPARAAVGLERPHPARLGSSAVPIGNRSVTSSIGRAAATDEQLSLARLRRSIAASHQLAFSGTEIVSAWHPGSSTTLVLDLVQGPDGVRTATAQDVGTSGGRLTGLESDGDALAGLSERALEALAAGYELRTGGLDRVAGRPATVVVAARDGRDVARMWLDDQTGLLLRQDVLDSSGRLHRMAAFVEMTVTDTAPNSASTADPVAPLRLPVQTFGLGRSSVPAVRRSARIAPQSNPQQVTPEQVTPDPAAPGPWSDVIGPAELTTLRADGWPCPVALAAGFVLLDARRKTSAGATTLHLTYGDGLSAISVFLQRGELDASGLTGLSSRKWGSTDVYVRAGWPEVMVWQGGPTVITAVGDSEPADLRTVLSALPRQPDHGTLGSLQHRMGSALAWFKG